MKWLKGRIVDALETVCGWLDEIPSWWRDEDGWVFYRHGQMGCLMGVASLALRLDDRWGTGHWTPSADFYEDDERVEDVTAAFLAGVPGLTAKPVTKWQSPDGSITLESDHLIGAPKVGKTPMIPFVEPIDPDVA